MVQSSLQVLATIKLIGVCDPMCMTWKFHEIILVGPSDQVQQAPSIQLLRLSYQEDVLKLAK